MTFIHVYLLGGLVLVGVPILLHLLLRQKPRRLPFAAFRFLKARRVTNQRRMRLQHIVLLALRMLILAAICLALARPLLFSHRLSGTSNRPVVAVLLFDISPSMEYSQAGVSRLDDARQKGDELLDEMVTGSRIAVLDNGDDQPGPPLPLADARSRIKGLRIREGAGSLNRAIESAVKLLQKEDPEAAPRFLYVFTDRTRACWDVTGPKPQIPEGINLILVDVGVDSPRDLGIDKIEVVPPVAIPGARIEIRVSLRGTADGHENVLSYRIDNDPDTERLKEEKPVTLRKGETGDVVVFTRAAPRPPPGGPIDVPYQLTARLATRDAMPFNNVRHATFLVRGSRTMLTLVDAESKGRTTVWAAAITAHNSFTNDIRTFEEANALSPRDLARYSVISLFQVAKVPDGWWPKLAGYVKNGGGLAVVPAGDEFLPEVKDFSDQGVKAGLLPAPLLKLVSAPPDKPLQWQRFSGDHPLIAAFVHWARQADPDFDRESLRPHVWRRWQLGPLVKGATPIARYADAGPALAGRDFGLGRVVLFTTPLDLRRTRIGGEELLWTNYYESSFGLALIDRTGRYLAGETSVPTMNFPTGVVPQVELPAPLEPPYTVTGPGIDAPDRAVPSPRAGEPTPIKRAVQAGNYLVLDSRDKPAAGFSLAVREQESDLARVPVEELEAALGPGVVLEVGQAVRLKDALTKFRPPPFEVLPWLMLLLLAVLALENLLSNRFYRNPAPGATGGPAA